MLPPARHLDPWPVVGFAAAASFVALAALVLRTGTLPFDAPIIGFVQGLGLPVEMWVAVTTLGAGVVLVPVAVALGLAALVTGRLRLLLIVVVVLLGATLFTEVAKEVIARPRPPGEPLEATSGLSFPSGHSANSAATYGLLAVVAWRSRLRVIVRRLTVAGGIALPVSIGLSRVALGVHYPSDVLGGWLAGLAFVAAGATLITVLGAMGRE